jgi:hypothetical protein
MARALSRREVYLITGLGAAAAIWLWYGWSASEPPAAVAAKKAEAARREMVFGRVPLVHMDQLDRAVVKYDSSGRDLFKYSTRPPSWAEVKRLKAEAAAAAKAQKEAEARALLLAEQKAKEDAERQEYLRLHPPPPPKPVPPPVMFQFIGFIGPPDGRIAALEQNNEVVLAKAGDIVKKDFKLEEIRYESVLISFVNPQFKGETRELPLSRGK